MINFDSGSSENGGFNLPDMTALLDVIFILLTFLLLTANAVPLSLDVSLPEDSQRSADAVAPADSLTISLFPEAGRWGINGREFTTWHSFESALMKQITTDSSKEVVLAGDRDVSLEKLLKLFSLLQKNNIATTQILMRQETAK
jgi:biopolymer transport protein ExbD